MHILFQFSTVEKRRYGPPKNIFYRGVRSISGTFRIEQRAENAKTWTACEWATNENELRAKRADILNSDSNLTARANTAS